MDRCPYCNVEVSGTEKFCHQCGNQLLNDAKTPQGKPSVAQQRKYRSPLLESPLYEDPKTRNSNGVLVSLSYIFWLFALIFVSVGIKTLVDSYTVNLYQGFCVSSLYWVLGLLCAVMPGLIGLFVRFENQLSKLLEQNKKSVDE